MALKTALSVIQNKFTLWGVEHVLRAPWVSVGSTSRVSGWKLHISFNADDLDKYVDYLLDLHLRRGLTFKVIQSVEHLVAQSDGALGDNQIGKCATIYPTDDNELGSLIEEILRNQPATAYEGPDIDGDLKMGRNLYIRYGQFNPIFELNQMGIAEAHIDLPNGVRIKDSYRYQRNLELWQGRTDGSGPEALIRDRRSVPPATMLLDYDIQSCVKRKSGASVYLATDRADGSKWIIKEACRGIKSDVYGRDARTRLQRESDALRRMAVNGFVPLSRAIFGTPDHQFLPIQFIKGETLLAAVRALKRAETLWHAAITPEAIRDMRFGILRSLRKTLDHIDTMHNLGVVHRDLTPNNIIIEPNGNPRFIDFEIAYFTQDTMAPFLGGTEGYSLFATSGSEVADLLDDYISLFKTVIYYVCGVEPKLLQPFWDREAWAAWCAAHAGDDHLFDEIMRLAALALQRDPALSVGLRDIIWELEHAPLPHLATMKQTDVPPAILPKVLASPALLSKQDNLWFAEDETSVNSGGRVISPSLYEGISGVLFFLAQLATVETVDDQNYEILIRAEKYLLDLQQSQVRSSGLYFGWGGVLLALLNARRAGLVNFDDHVVVRLIGYVEKGRNGWLDLTHGEAGVILALIEAIEFLDSDLESRRLAFGLIRRISTDLAEMQAADGSWKSPDGVNGMSGQTFLGHAHGTGGIGMAMLAAGKLLADDSLIGRAQQAAYSILAGARFAEGKFSLPISDQVDSAWNWWCHGNAGVAPFLIAAGEISQDRKLQDAGRLAISSATSAYLSDNISVCHGMTGVAQMLMDCFLLTGDTELLRQSGGMMDRVIRMRHRGSISPTSDRYWRIEARRFQTAGLMKGQSGLLITMLRHIHGPHNIAALPGSNYLIQTFCPEHSKKTAG